VTKLVEALRCKPEDHGFDSQWVIYIFHHLILAAALWPWGWLILLTAVSTGISFEGKHNRCVGLTYVVLPKNFGTLNRAHEPVVVCPSAARCGEQYALWMCVPTVVKLRGRVIQFSAFLWGYILVIRWIFLQLIWPILRSKESASNFVTILKITTAENHQLLQEDNAMNQSKLLWYKRFKDGWTSVDNSERSGGLDKQNTGKHSRSSRGYPCRL